MRDDPYRSNPERAGSATGTPHDGSAGDRARDHPLGESHPDARDVDGRDRELAHAALSAEDPRGGSNIAHQIKDDVFKAKTLADLAISAEDPDIGNDIAPYINPNVTDANGDSIHDTALGTVAIKHKDPRRGADIAQGIQTEHIKAETFAIIAISADDPYIGADIAHYINPIITDTHGDSIHDTALGAIAIKHKDPRGGIGIADGIQSPEIYARTLSEIAINAEGPFIGSEIAHHIDPTIKHANGDSLRNTTLTWVARNARSSEVGRHIADGIGTARIRIDTVNAINSAAQDDRRSGGRAIAPRRSRSPGEAVVGSPRCN